MSKICKIEGCDGDYVARGWCRKHYLRWWKYGDVNTVKHSDGGQGRITPKQAQRYLELTGTEQGDTDQPEESPSTHEIAWAAGIIEADGCFTHKNHGDLGVQVSQKEPWLVHELNRLFGGRIKDTGVGGNYWEWRLSGARARGMAMTVYQFMSPQEQSKVREALESAKRWRDALKTVIEEDRTMTYEELNAEPRERYA